MHPCSGRKSKFVEGMQRQWLQWQETRETENRALQMQLSNKNSKEEGICDRCDGTGAKKGNIKATRNYREGNIMHHVCV